MKAKDYTAMSMPQLLDAGIENIQKLRAKTISPDHYMREKDKIDAQIGVIAQRCEEKWAQSKNRTHV